MDESNKDEPTTPPVKADKSTPAPAPAPGAAETPAPQETPPAAAAAATAETPDFFPEDDSGPIEELPPPSQPAPPTDPITPPGTFVPPEIENAPDVETVRMGKKGRHAKDCPCKQCVAKRLGYADPAKKSSGANASSAGFGTDLFAAPTSAPVDYVAMSGVVFDMSTNVLSMTLGNEWQPQSGEERKLVVSSLADYFKSKEVKDVPPGVMLCFVLAAYSAPRLQKPNTSGKLKLFYHWTRNKVGNFFANVRGMFGGRNQFKPTIVKNDESKTESVD